ncbi:MAG: hypothetical protein B6U75_01025 [Desulfurococcales archaeon ex4484_217_1]|nr:MAG: hypothetical protein B6U75_01025 [Desulfurococcales archaeon ex4484_217_1]
MKVDNVVPVLVIMFVAWTGLLITLYVINLIVSIIPQGASSTEKLLYSIVKIGLSAFVAFVWLSLWFLMTLKYRNMYLRK